MQGMPVEDFQNVVPLEKQVPAHLVRVDTPDTAPPADAAEQGLTTTQNGQPQTPSPSKSAVAPSASVVPPVPAKASQILPATEQAASPSTETPAQ